MGRIFALVVLLAATSASAQILPQSKRDRQRDWAHKLEPAQIQLRVVESAPAEPRPLRVRVYAARDYRNVVMSWQARIRRLVDRVNQRVRRWPGVRFEVVELKDWDRDSTDSIDKMIDALRALDPGDDVDYVLGLATAIPLFPDNLHQIGGAQVLGKHMVIRNLHDLAEYEMVRTELDLLDDSDRERLLAARKAHKEEIVFLHEWGHTLGAIHVHHPTLVMNPSYDHEQFTIDDANARVMDISLSRRGNPRQQGHELKELIQASKFDDWDPGDRKHLLALATQMEATPPPRARPDKNGYERLDKAEEPPKPTPKPVASDAYAQLYEAAHEALGTYKMELANQLARQLSRDFPDRPGGAVVTEEIAAAHAAAHRNLREAGKRLRHAIELDPQNRFAWQAMAEVYRLLGDRANRARLAADYERVFGKPLP